MSKLYKKVFNIIQKIYKRELKIFSLKRKFFIIKIKKNCFLFVCVNWVELRQSGKNYIWD